MKAHILMAGLFIATAPLMSNPAQAASAQMGTKYVTVNGEVVKYEPGRVIVIRGTDNREMVYTIGPSVVVPADVGTGRQVTLYTEAGPDGSAQVVTRVTTTSISAGGAVRKTTEDYRTNQSGETTRTIVGDVIRYEPGRVIVVRQPDNHEVQYTLSANVAVPADVKVGRRVTLYTEPGPEGTTQTVTRVVTTSITPEGQVKRTTEDTRTTQGTTSTTTTTTISGRVVSYEPGRTLTITREDGTRATYVITGTSTVPSDLAIGKTIAIVPVATVSPSGELVVRTITYVKPR